MTAGLCKWPHWTSNCCPPWPRYLLEDVANLTRYSNPVTSRGTVKLFEASATARPVWVFIIRSVLNIPPFASLLLHSLLTHFEGIDGADFFHVSHKNFNPPTSYHIKWQHMSRHTFFRVASPSAVRRILFSFQSKCHNDWYVWQSKAIIHLCTVCNAAFMHRSSFLFHSSNIFWSWQRAPRKVESQSQHIIPTYCLCWSRKPQALSLMLRKQWLDGLFLVLPLYGCVVVLACLLIFTHFVL